MVKTTGPLLSINAHGQLAKTLNYSQRKEGNIGRQFHYPHKEPSQKQYTRRTILGLLTAHWQCMTAAQKLVWENATILGDLNISGFNYFIQSAIADLKTHHGLCGYWSFNELTGASVLDYSGNENTGTLKPTYPSDVPSRIDSINKKFGKALSFNGSSAYVDCGSDNSINIVGDLTLSAWINRTMIGFMEIVANGLDGANGYRFLIVPTTHFLRFDTLGGGIRKNTLGKTAIGTAHWYNVVAVLSGTTASLYVNGIDEHATSVTHDNLVAATRPVLIGIYSTLAIGAFNGLIDEVRIYNRALSPAEIMKHYELLRRPNRRQIRLV